MQYLGSKSRISNWILDQIEFAFPTVKNFVDLFAGTGSVSICASNRGYRLYANDIQPYSSTVLKALFQSSRGDLKEVSDNIQNLKSDDHLLSCGRKDAKNLLIEERRQFALSKMADWQWEQYKAFCDSTPLVKGSLEEIQKLRENSSWCLFTKYYSNTYFGVEQCLQLDTIREYAEGLSTDARDQVLAATITAMTYGMSSTTHLAQYLKPTSKIRSKNLIQRRKYDFFEEIAIRLRKLSSFELPMYEVGVFQSDYKSVLDNIFINNDSVVYVDPPYFKEHYSRYYHVLDTFLLYDYPTLTYNSRISSTSIGRYREDRKISDFGLKGSVLRAFETLFQIVKQKKAKLAVSYANTSLVKEEQLLSLASQVGLNCDVKEIRLMHSGQGQPRNKTVTEFLFLMEP